jgi:putative FmdB family regulatory protein
MPLYEYHCKSCGNDFEKRVSFAEADSNPDCPECDSPETNKRISLFAAHGTSATGGSALSAANCGSSGGFS